MSARKGRREAVRCRRVCSGRLTAVPLGFILARRVAGVAFCRIHPHLLHGGQSSPQDICTRRGTTTLVCSSFPQEGKNERRAEAMGGTGVPIERVSELQLHIPQSKGVPRALTTAVAQLRARACGGKMGRGSCLRLLFYQVS